MGEITHLDEAALVELEEIMEDEFNILLETYLADALVRLSSIEAAIKAEDLDMLREAAHSLKGSSSNMGAMPLSGLCGNVEDLARENQLDQAITIVPGVRAEYEKVRTLLQQRLKADL